MNQRYESKIPLQTVADGTLEAEWNIHAFRGTVSVFVDLSSPGGPPLQTPAVEPHIVLIHQVLRCILVAWNSDCNKNYKLLLYE